MSSSSGACLCPQTLCSTIAPEAVGTMPLFEQLGKAMLSDLRALACALSFPRRISVPLTPNQCNTPSKSQQKHPTFVDIFLNLAPQAMFLSSTFKPCVLFLRKSFGILIDLHTSEKVWGLMLTIVNIHMTGYRWTLETKGKIILIVSSRTFLQPNLDSLSTSPVKCREML